MGYMWYVNINGNLQIKYKISSCYIPDMLNMLLLIIQSHIVMIIV